MVSVPGGITAITLQDQTLRLVKQGQATMALLQEQLSSGKKTTDLSNLSAPDTRNLLDLRANQSRRENYQSVIGTLTPRVQTTAASMEGMQTLISSIRQAINGANNGEAAVTAGLASQTKDALSQVDYYMNQKIDGRYVFSGNRYDTAPLVDLTTLAVPPTEAYPFVPVSPPAVPLYDTDYDALNPTAAVAGASIKDSVAIDDGLNVTYGVTSTDPAFQKMIQGLRYAYAASQDPANYDNYTAKASALLNDAQTAMRGVQATNAANQSLLKSVDQRHDTFISLMKSDQDDIQKIDTAEVAAKITTLQTQIEASYAATARITKLSILNYL